MRQFDTAILGPNYGMKSRLLSKRRLLLERFVKQRLRCSRTSVRCASRPSNASISNKILSSERSLVDYSLMSNKAAATDLPSAESAV